MTIEEELVWLREEKKELREQLAQRDELIQQQQALLAEQNAVIQHHAQQMSRLSEQVSSLRERLAKESHNSHLPPSSDRCGRKPKSLRTPSEKKSGGQPGHPGSSLQFSSTPEEITPLQVDRCEACQQDEASGARLWKRASTGAGSARASSGGAPIAGGAETVSGVPADHHRRLSRRSAGSHPRWPQCGSNGGVPGRTAVAALGP